MFFVMWTRKEKLSRRERSSRVRESDKSDVTG